MSKESPQLESFRDNDDNLPPLRTLLPDLEGIDYDTLKQKFEDLALRCFNSENKLDLALELIRSYEAVIRLGKEHSNNYEQTIKDLREEVDEQMIEISDLRDRIPERPDFKNNVL